MSTYIEIRDLDPNGILSVTYANILPLLEPEGRSLAWSILFFNGVGDLGPDFTIESLEAAIKNSSTGVILPWEQMKAVLSRAYQVYDGMLVGCGEADRIPKLGSIYEMAPSCEIIIEAFDSAWFSFWAREKKMVDRVAAHYDDVVFREIRAQ